MTPRTLTAAACLLAALAIAPMARADADAADAPLAAADTTAPRITAASLSKRLFRVASARTAISSAAKGGTDVRFTLSEDAVTTLTVTAAGRKPVRLTRARTTQGANVVPYTGRTARGKLASGRYQMTLVATDAAGNRSAAVSLPFKVVGGY